MADAPSAQPLPRPPKPYQWPARGGAVQMWQLRDYARWLFPQLDKEWASPGVKDFTLKPEVQGKKAEPYQFPKSKGVCLMRHLKHFGAYVIPTLKASIQDTQVTVAEEGVEFFREVSYGPQQAKPKDEFRWPHQTGLAFVSDLQALDRYLQPLLTLKAQRGAGVVNVDL